jgi:hypothetical protein
MADFVQKEEEAKPTNEEKDNAEGDEGGDDNANPEVIS